ncbi:MAG: SPOR domain-containing protein [Gammaproteobacteria bacterium]|nr:SPOR domain-containing protein [Gammaproteobacteria bacterium]
MNDILIQRLVGALVIVVLAVIFWPVIFVGPEGEPLDRSTQVPGIPSLQQMQLDAPEPLRGIAPVRSAPASEVSLAAAEIAESEQPEVLDKEGIPIAWTLQVVSVSKQDKAEVLMRQLLDMGYKAYFKAVSHGDGTLYQVYVGPKFERDKMQDAKPVIDKKFRVNSIVVRYLP